MAETTKDLSIFERVFEKIQDPLKQCARSSDHDVVVGAIAAARSAASRGSRSDMELHLSGIPEGVKKWAERAVDEAGKEAARDVIDEAPELASEIIEALPEILPLLVA